MEAGVSLREQKRSETSRRITRCAQQLTDEHGLDGFTMDDLTNAADVSRRTLFNYFPSKLDAVLGETPEIPESTVEVFRSGGPHGNLVDDLAEIARIALADKEAERSTIQRARRLFTTNSRLMAAAHERFETITEELAALVIEREGGDFGVDKARLLLRLLLAMFDCALFDLLDGDDRTLVEIFDDQLRDARTLFG